MERDVPERYLLRLGMGEAELDAEQVCVCAGGGGQRAPTGLGMAWHALG